MSFMCRAGLSLAECRLLAGAAATCGEEVAVLQVRGEERRLFPAHRITAAQVSRIYKVL